MQTRTRIAALAAAVVFGAGAMFAGTAWAQDDGGAAQPPAPATPNTNDVSANSLGGGEPEAHFVAITPCRIVDTRQVGGKLAVGAIRPFVVRGDGPDFFFQGGKPNGCGIPTEARAVEVTMTAVDAGSGFLRAWPANRSAPNATFMNYTSAFNVSNTGTVAICKTCVLGDLSVRAFGSPTHLVADVSGYYVQKPAAQINTAGATRQGNRVVSSQNLGLGTYEVIFDRDVSTCSYLATLGFPSGGVSITTAARATDGNGVFVSIEDENGAAIDQPFYVEVTC